MLGDVAVLDWIRRYLVTMEEKYGFGSLSPPDPMVSAWTGSKQSFLDLEKESIYTSRDDFVSRADLLRCRFDLKLQDSAGSNLSWRPFGSIQKKQVELELRPQLETKYTRKYHSFTWYIDKKQAISDKGFRVCTGRNVHFLDEDNLGKMLPPVNWFPRSVRAINVRPSRESTLMMMEFLIEDAVGNRDWAISGMKEREKFSWLRDWEGLDFMDGALTDVGKLVKAPSWFLQMD
ncbi:hypothetical protein FVEN_g5565 [Fusarium venenatum]|nr:hypothetical protein FVEN_g5565 [Fusarium venenatum]KAH6965124.1 hypothetical protein EDB82DRAFT_289939 [Fusarium venenatum]